MFTRSEAPLAVPNLIFIALLASSLLEVLTSWGGLEGIRLVVAGAGLFLTAAKLNPLEIVHLRKTCRVPAILFIIPVLWMLIQLLPISAIGNPIWSSAAAGLGLDLPARATVDLGSAALSLAHLLLFASMVILGCALSVDRARAEQNLVSLALLATLFGAVGLLESLRPGSPANSVENGWANAAALGVILTLACAHLYIERFETRRVRQRHPFASLFVMQLACVLGFLICMSVVIGTGTRGLAFATMCGVATFVGIAASRRTGLERLGTSAVLVTLSVIAVGLGAAAVSGGSSIVTAYSSAPLSSINITDRMLADVRVMGTGPGTVDLLSSIYKAYDDPPFIPPSAAAIALIELGRAMFFAVAVLLILVLALMTRGSLRRGRDSVYAIAGASGLTTLLVSSFVDVGALNTGVTLLLGGVIGVALAQTEGRSAAQFSPNSERRDLASSGQDLPAALRTN